MIIEHKKIVKIDELADIIPFKQGATWNSLWQIFYYTRLFKYVKRSFYPKIKIAFNKICTDRKLLRLCELGYLFSPQKDVYCASNKVLPILKEVGFNIEALPAEPQGSGNINELNNTQVFIDSLKVENFYALLFCNFGYIVPDALMVLLDKEESRYKLIFLEIEAQKPDWHEYIENKINNYFKLARDMQFFNYWLKQCKLLKITPPAIEDLKFSVCIVGNIKKELRTGFIFTENLLSHGLFK